MKLRIKGDSLRLRVSRSEVARFGQGERIAETIHFAPAAEAQLTYALQQRQQAEPVVVEYANATATVYLSGEQSAAWLRESEVGVYTSVGMGANSLLEVIVEKDFACLDRSGEDNADTFANPNATC